MAFGTYKHIIVKLNITTDYFEIVGRLHQKSVLFYLQNMDSEAFPE